MKTVEQYRIFECRIQGNSGKGVFKFHDTVKTVQGYAIGAQVVVRFMPDQVGTWSYHIESDCTNVQGMFLCAPAQEGNHGPVRVQASTFRYDDGTAYLPFGTTCYGWIHQSAALRDQTLTSLAASPFNKVRMCLFPKSMVYNTGEPEQFPFRKDSQGNWDVNDTNPAFWENLEKQILALDELNIQADLILFHPYDRWGFAKLSRKECLTYLSYCVRRLSAFKNIWWSLANEYDILPGKTEKDWDAFAHCVCENDPAGHLLSIHNCCQPYPDRGWMTHCSLQTNLCRQSLTLGWQYNKPIVIDECGYEGNIEFTWGNLSAFEMVNRFWITVVCGGYATHGETFYRQDEILWWGKGGTLQGKSVERIAFLRNLLESLQGVARPALAQLTADPNGDTGNSGMGAFGAAMMRMPEAAQTAFVAELVPMICGNEAYRIYYLGRTCPAWLDVQCPAKGTYTVEVIDVWAMTRTPAGQISEAGRISLPGTEGMAVLLTKMEVTQ